MLSEQGARNLDDAEIFIHNYRGRKRDGLLISAHMVTLEKDKKKLRQEILDLKGSSWPMIIVLFEQKSSVSIVSF